MSAIDKCIRIEDKRRIRWNKTSIIVARVKIEDGVFKFGMSKPCVHCTQSIKMSRIHHVFWTNQHGEFEGCRVCDLETCHLCRRKRIELDVYSSNCQ